MTALPGRLRERLVILIGAGLVLASICNGAVFYLKRIGVLDHAAYQAYWSAHCLGKTAPSPLTAAPGCAGDEGPEPNERTPEQLAFEDARSSHLYRSEGYEVALKLVKDVLAIGFILLSVVLIRIRMSRFPALVSSWPLAVLAAIVVFGLARAYSFQEGAFALAGLRSYLFLAIALTAGWVSADMRIFARCIALVLCIELLLMPFEFAYGMHVHGHFGDTSFLRRMCGTLVAPNSFGIFAVAGLAFHHAFSGARKCFFPMLAVTIVLVAASGSATGWLALLVFLIASAVAKAGTSHPVAISLSAIALCIVLLLALPAMVGRADVFESVLGPGARLDEIASVFRSSTAIELIAGQGLGVGSNAEGVLFGAGDGAMPGGPRVGPFQSAESTVVALILQSGLVGLLAFYSVLAWAFWRDRQARPFYAVIALSSLTAKIPELFPVNFLLGLALAHSVGCASPVPAVPTSGKGPQK